MPVLIGFFALALGLYALRAYTRALARRARAASQAGRRIFGADGARLSLTGAGRIDFGLGLGAAGFWLHGRFGARVRALRRRGAARGVSRVRSAMIEMELDHASGAIRGTILAGKDEGKRLDALTRPALMELYSPCRATTRTAPGC